VSAAPPPKKKASEKKQAIIPKKLSYEKTDAELNASVKSDVDSFFKKLKTEREAKRNPEKPYLLLRPEDLRQRVEAEQKKRREAQKESSSLSDYDRTLRKSIEEEKKKEKRARKGVAQLGEQSKQSVPPLVIGNEYGSNIDVLDQQIPADLKIEELEIFFAETGLSLAQMIAGAPIESAPQIDHWQKEYTYGKSLYNPAALSKLGTQMYMLNKWYMEACARKADDYICVRIRNYHYFRGDDIIYVQFNELHQLCHMDALDKSLMSCFCL
jgi:hypothetical protein